MTDWGTKLIHTNFQGLNEHGLHYLKTKLCIDSYKIVLSPLL